MTFRWTCALFAAVVAVVAAVPTAEPANGQAPAPRPTETLVKLTMKAEAAPVPALRYVLLPELHEMQVGNSLYGYLRSFYPERSFLHTQEAQAKRETWLGMPIKELPRQEVRQYVYNSAFTGIQYAARLTNCDWEILDRMRKDGINLLIPDVQVMRNMAAWLSLRVRYELAEGDFPAAVETIKTMLRVARDMGEHPTLIGQLVGIAIASIAFSQIDLMLDQPGAPNLYWALTNLPVSLIDLRKGMQGERFFVKAEFDGLLDRESPMSPDQLNRCIDKMRMLVTLSDDRSPGIGDVGVILATRASSEESMEVARKAMVAAGMNEEHLKRLPPLQVLLLDELRRYETVRDELFKWMPLPYPQCWDGIRQTREQAEKDGGHQSALLKGLLPAVQKVRQAQGRLDRRVAITRAVEAVRLYAAAHNGELPADLASAGVPVPDDPLTGKPFGYRRNGSTYEVTAPTPPGEDRKNFSLNLRYQVTIRK
jgi:hypothetical protein